MTETSEPYLSLRERWINTPPDVTYRFTVSFDVWGAAGAANNRVKTSRRTPGHRFIDGLIMLAAFPLVLLALLVMAAMSFGVGHIVDRLMDVTGRFGGNLLPVVSAVATFLGLGAACRVALKRHQISAGSTSYDYYYRGRIFVIEGHKALFWLDEQFAGELVRWSTFERLVEIEGGLWLMMRRQGNFAGQNGFIISQESLPGSCSWDEIRDYLKQRLEEHQSTSQHPTE